MRISNAASDFLFELYHDASTCTPNTLRLRCLKKLQALVPFDFAVWGGGRAEDRRVTDLVVLDQSEAVLGQWDAVADRDAFCDLTLARLGATARFDDVPAYRESFAFNEHWRRFDARHMMATITGEPTDGYVSFVGLCAEKRPRPFTNAERAFKQKLMPHFSQALRMNRALWTRSVAPTREAVGLVDRAGWVLATHGPFDDFAAAEWGTRTGPIAPDIMAALLRARRWRGRTLDARLDPFEGNFFLSLTVQPLLSHLSPRERDVAELYASGLSYKQVARALGTSPSTVRNQVARIYEKLGVASKAALAALVAGR